ncbi:MAG TPA: alpha-ketoacid dehydrogenase subunit beta [Gaiellaceae bacterium]|jgi:pyruvate/2-oxoglutarate/acetoin dehydrogenase E1 component|nr:alpha-ketoacid dehydrogenase subunit beta [Gaiellaceae bacterium]
MRTISYAAAIREALAEEMERDELVFLLGEDIGQAGGVFGVTQGLYERFGPTRVLDTPISEEALVGAGVGASLLGGRPVVEVMFSDFATLAMDMIVNQAAKTHYMTGGRLSAPLTIRLVTGTAGATSAQHSQSLEAWFVHTPGLKCVAPATPLDAKALMKAAIRDPDPVCFFEHKLLYNTKAAVPEVVEPLPFGQGCVVREGTDITAVSYLNTLHETLAAADELEQEGISLEVFDPRSLVPFDRAGLRASLERTGRLLIAHEAPQRGGFGAEIAAIAASEMWELLRGPIVRVCGTNTPMPYAPELEGFVIPDRARIAAAARSMITAGVA